ncbi:MAG TPA: adenylate/guanylate cyclase domain-containing protein [Actinomycetota bacterium]|nr:adenylate/guanylate cyclase domain-containing protein [Actinomycetota bacterium]
MSVPTPPATDGPIDHATLARRSGVDDAAIERLVDLGILERGEDGTFREQDITAVRLSYALEASGVSLDDVGDAIAGGALPPLGAVLLLPPVGLRPRTYREAAAAFGLEPRSVAATMEALGLPDVDLDAPVREDDEELLQIAGSVLQAGLPEETTLRTLRIFAEHLDRMAEHQRTLFRRDVQDRMLATGMSRSQMLRESAATREFLVQVSYRTSHLIHRRLLERNAFENTTEQLELLLEEAGVRRRPDRDPPAIVFVDLSGYTRMTEEEGDERAAERGTELAQVVRRAVGRHGGRVVKLLGDGAMVRFERADAAVAAALDIVDAVDESPLPSAHVGIAAGAMIQRDGDYFGHTVNIAARLCDAATAGSILATGNVAELTPGRDWRDVGDLELRGVPEPVAAVELSPPD